VNLHEWIAARVEAAERIARSCDATDWRHVFDGVIVDRDTDGWQHAPDAAVIAHIAYERIYWSTSPAHSPEADHIVHNDPDAVLRRCEADRRILARHRLPEPGDWLYPACDGCGTTGEFDDPVSDNINDCPELLDLAHAHGITEADLAALDRLERVGVAPTVPFPRMAATPAMTTDQIPAALRGARWRRHHH